MLIVFDQFLCGRPDYKFFLSLYWLAGIFWDPVSKLKEKGYGHKNLPLKKNTIPTVTGTFAP